MDISALGIFQVFIGMLTGYCVFCTLPQGSFNTVPQGVFHWLLFIFVGGSIGFLLI